MSDVATWRAAALDWMRHDPDPATRAATEAMLDDPARLRACFGSTLDFGTAGLRGPLGPGPACMNRVVVRGVAAAVATWLGSGRVVIGYDARHGSREFAEESASILGGRGFDVWLFDGICPTPELAWAVRNLGAKAGVMVTASHNPPQDNGYKLYDADGIQILPDDASVIAAAWAAAMFPPEGPPLAELRAAGRVRSVPATVGAAWIEGLLALRVHPPADRAPIRIVYTAMHGVGTARALELLGAAGHRDVYPVPEQCTPDGDFPTVAFPNPEEPGAMDLAMAAARERKADLVIANDPDADRLAVGVPDGAGGYRMLSGNEVGWLLAEDLLSAASGGGDRFVATTVVSSGMLRKIAQAHGASYGETLTGFKWIGRLAHDVDARGGRFVLGYEESLGYVAGGLTRDKDGVGAALLFADLAASCKARGDSVLGRLAAIHRRHGLHCGGSHNVRLSGPDAMARMAASIRKLQGSPPTSLGGRKVLRIRDVLRGTDTDVATGEVRPLDLPTSELVAYDLEGGRALARPSGTEPKFKLYYEVVLPTGDADLAALEREAGPLLTAIRDDLLAAAGLV